MTWLTAQLVRLGCFAAGGYRALKVLSRGDYAERLELLVFFAVLGVFELYSTYLEWLVSWFPFYYYLKSGLLCLLLVPRLRVPRIIFHTTIIPAITTAHQRLSEEVLPSLLELLQAAPFLLLQLILNLFLPGLLPFAADEDGADDSSAGGAGKSSDGASRSTIATAGGGKRSEMAMLRERARCNRTTRDIRSLSRKHHKGVLRSDGAVVSSGSNTSDDVMDVDENSGGGGSGGEQDLDKDPATVDADGSPIAASSSSSPPRAHFRTPTKLFRRGGKTVSASHSPQRRSGGGASGDDDHGMVDGGHRRGGGHPSSSPSPSRTTPTSRWVRTLLTGSDDVSVRDHLFDLSLPPPPTPSSAASSLSPSSNPRLYGSGRLQSRRSRSSIGTADRRSARGGAGYASSTLSARLRSASSHPNRGSSAAESLEKNYRRLSRRVATTPPQNYNNSPAASPSSYVGSRSPSSSPSSSSPGSSTSALRFRIQAARERGRKEAERKLGGVEHDANWSSVAASRGRRTVDTMARVAGSETGQPGEWQKRTGLLPPAPPSRREVRSSGYGQQRRRTTGASSAAARGSSSRDGQREEGSSNSDISRGGGGGGGGGAINI